MAFETSDTEAVRIALSNAGPIPNATLYNNGKDLWAGIIAAGISVEGTPIGPAGGDLAGTYPNPVLAPVGVAGTYTKVTTDSKGRVISGETLPPGGVPVGTIIHTGQSTIPAGFLDCDGSSQLRSAYPDLFAAIGTTYGPGTVPGTTFALPTVIGTYGNFAICADVAAIIVETQSLIGAPIGSLLLYANATYPTGWLRANGTAISRTTYADLFAIIGTTYGAGDGSTTFNLPNLSSSGTGSPVYIIKAILSGSVEPSTVAHAASHIRAGTDVIDGDRVQIDYVPTNYTRNAGASGAGAVTDLTAHLNGVDTRILSLPQGEIAFTESTSNSLVSNIATGLNTTVVLQTGRYYKASFLLSATVSATNLNIRALGTITINGTSWRQRAYDYNTYVGGGGTFYPQLFGSVVFTVAASGSTALAAQLAPIAGTWALNATTTERHYLLIEDIGAV